MCAKMRLIFTIIIIQQH